MSSLCKPVQQLTNHPVASIDVPGGLQAEQQIVNLGLGLCESSNHPFFGRFFSDTHPARRAQDFGLTSALSFYRENLIASTVDQRHRAGVSRIAFQFSERTLSGRSSYSCCASSASKARERALIFSKAVTNKGPAPRTTRSTMRRKTSRLSFASWAGHNGFQKIGSRARVRYERGRHAPLSTSEEILNDITSFRTPSLSGDG